jgi:hypothetical protein
MLKLAVNAMIAAMLLAFPIAFCISQTTGAGIGEVTTVSQRLTAEDNNIINSDIYQVSTVKNGDTNHEGSSGGNSDEPEENSGGSSGDSSGDGSGNGSGGDNGAGTGGGSNGGQSGGNNSGSGGSPQDSSIGSSSEGFREAEAITSGQLLGNPVNPVVINELHPRPEETDQYGNERVELFNIGKNPVNVSLWYMKNMTGQVIGTIHDKVIPSSGFLVVNVTGLTGDYQTVTLFDPGSNKIDSVIYIGARSHNGSCYARIPDGASTWEWTTCTLGSSNRQR